MPKTITVEVTLEATADVYQYHLIDVELQDGETDEIAVERASKEALLKSEDERWVLESQYDVNKITKDVFEAKVSDFQL
jgi:hypothetical protein